MNAVTNRLKEIEPTEATRFVLPMLYKTDRTSNFFITKNFINCYIADANRPDLGNKIFLLYHYQLAVDFLKFERSLEFMSEFNTDYDYADDRLVMYVMDIPEAHTEDFQHFLKGEYSKFSEVFKTNILAFWGDKGKKENPLYPILYATTPEGDIDFEATNCAEGELWPKPVLTREIYMTQ